MTGYKETLRRQALEMPRVRFVCERDWMTGPDTFAIGVLWNRNIDAQPGEFVYRKRIVLRWVFRLRLEWKLQAPVANGSEG